MIQTFSPFSLPPYAAKHEAHCLGGQEKELLDYEYIAPVTNVPPMTELLGILSLSAWLLVCCEHQFEWIKCSDRESTEKKKEVELFGDLVIQKSFDAYVWYKEKCLTRYLIIIWGGFACHNIWIKIGENVLAF